MTILLFVIATLALLLTLPFVRLYTDGITDVKYIDMWLPILFATIFLMSQIRSPAILTINASGSFRETQWGAIAEAIINLAVSLALFFFTDLGMKGLLLGTIVSYLFRTTDVILFVYRHLMERSIWRFVRLVVTNLVAMGALIAVFYLWRPVVVSSYLSWLLWAIVIGMITVMTFGVFNLLINFRDTKEMLAGVLHKFRRGQKTV